MDEYETEFVAPFDRSEAPLSMGELIGLIDGSVGMRDKPGQVRPVLDTDSGNRLVRASVLRSLADRLAVRLEGTWFGGDPRVEPQHALWHETLLSLALVPFF